MSGVILSVCSQYLTSFIILGISFCMYLGYTYKYNDFRDHIILRKFRNCIIGIPMGILAGLIIATGVPIAIVIVAISYIKLLFNKYKIA